MVPGSLLSTISREMDSVLKCLVVVAHPDDEVIWMGGTILKYGAWDWRVLALCRADDADREPRFRQSIRALGARGSISDLDDSSPVLAPLSLDLYEIKDRIKALDEREFDMIFTHGLRGEYTSHERHPQTHKVVKKLIESGDFTGDLISFAYEDGEGAYRPRPAADAQIIVSLNLDEYARKQNIIENIYGFHRGSIEYDAAGPLEAFHVYGDDQAVIRVGKAFNYAGDIPCEY